MYFDILTIQSKGLNINIIIKYVSGSNRVCDSKNKVQEADGDGRFLFNEEIYKKRI
jgi:hypothetical protein